HSSGSSVDQRGLPRSCDDATIANAAGGDGADIGAFEVQGCIVNHAPVAVDDNAAVNQDTTLTVAFPGVLGNDTDADGDTLNAVLVTGVSHGTLTLNGNGSFTYTPATGFACVDTFTYKANDGIADSNAATVTIHVIDTQAPSVVASVTHAMLWPPNHELINVGFSFSAADN